MRGPGSDGIYEKSVDRFGQWVQFEDAKASAVLVLLGLGFVDLLGHASSLIHAHELRSNWGDVASLFFWLAIVAAAAAIALVVLALKPRARSTQSSIFFFGTVSGYADPEEYRDAVESKWDARLEREMASQAWQLARILATKVRLIGWAYWLVATFLAAWAVARLALGVAQ